MRLGGQLGQTPLACLELRDQETDEAVGLFGDRAQLDFGSWSFVEDLPQSRDDGVLKRLLWHRRGNLSIPPPVAR